MNFKRIENKPLVVNINNKFVLFTLPDYIINFLKFYKYSPDESLDIETIVNNFIKERNIELNHVYNYIPEIEHIIIKDLLFEIMDEHLLDDYYEYSEKRDIDN